MADNIIPIFMLGAAHSGTTIFHRMLAMHPDIVWFSQFSQRGGRIPGRLCIPYHHQLDRTLRYLFVHDWRKEQWWLRRLLVPHPSEANRTWQYMIPENEIISSDESIRRIQSVMEEECRSWRRAFLITKLPRLYRHILILANTYPEAKFVHIVRDGRAVALSNRHKFMRHHHSETEGLRASAVHWAEVINEVNLQESTVDMFEVKYEDFCADVHDCIRQFLIHVGLQMKTFPFNRCPEKLEVTNKRWFQDATEAELVIVEEMQEDYLRQYGYKKRH